VDKKITVVALCNINYTVEQETSANRLHVERRASELRRKLRSLHRVSL